MKKLNKQRDIYALAITGAGEKFFSAGADLKLFTDGDPATARTMAEYFGQAFETLADFRGVSIGIGHISGRLRVDILADCVDWTW